MKRMLISVDLEESRAAVVDDNQLVHLEIEPVNRDSVKGNIYRGVVARVEQSLQSAFVDFGRDKQGFLPVGEIHPKIKGGNTDKRPPIQDILRAGQVILVQVTKDEIGNKGATLTTFISLPGRYLVLMPESDKTGVSRKLSDAARDRVKEITEKMKVPDGFGLIVRTAGERATKLELTKDLVYLNRLWNHIETGATQGKGPTALYHERSLAIRFVRDYFKSDINEIVVDDEDTLGEVQAYLKVLMPRNLSAVERYSGVIPLFARYGIAGQVEDVFSRQVPLAGGGSIVIDQTEALVAVDVNSGRVKGKDIEETARQTNIEAAKEVARQLVLRDLGGLVVVDFIDMRDRKYVREVEAALKSSMKMDKARHKIGRISEFGLMELSRQRLKSSVNKGVFESCDHCSGTGFYRTTESVAASVMRRIHELVAKGDVAYLVVTMPPEAANYLLNSKRAELANVEREYHVSVEIVGVEGMTAAQVTIEHLQRLPSKSGATQIREARFKRVTRRLDLVRNKLLNREEARIERRLSVELSGAAVDYADVYNGVLEDTAGMAEETRLDDERKADRRRRDRARRNAAAEAPAQSAPIAAPVVDIMAEAPMPQPQGFTSWLKGLFGFRGKGGPELALTVDEPTPQAEPAEASAPAPRDAADAASSGRSGRGRSDEGKSDDAQQDDGRRKRSRRRRRRDSDAEVEAQDGQTASSDDDAPASRRERPSRRRRNEGDRAEAAPEKSGTEQSPRESADATDGDDEDNPRRRRRRRRRGGRRRSRDEVDGQEAGGQDDKASTRSADAASDDEGTEDRSSRRSRRDRPRNAPASDGPTSDSAAGASAPAEGAAANGMINVKALAETRIAALRATHGLPTPQAAAPVEDAEASKDGPDDVSASSADADATVAPDEPATEGKPATAPAAETAASAAAPEGDDSAAQGQPADEAAAEGAQAAAQSPAASEGAPATAPQHPSDDAAEASKGAPEPQPLPRGIPAVIDMRSGGNSGRSSGR